MARIITTNKLKVEDFPGQKEWAPPLFNTINRFFIDTISAVNNGLTFKENFIGVEKEVSFVYSGSQFPFTFSWGLTDMPQEVKIIYLYEAIDPINKPKSFRSVATSLNWEFTGTEIQVNDILLHTTYRGSLVSGTATVKNMTSTVGIYGASMPTTQTITGTGIPASTTVASVDSSTQITMSANATATNDNVFLNIGANTALTSGLVSGFGYKIKFRAVP